MSSPRVASLACLILGGALAGLPGGADAATIDPRATPLAVLTTQPPAPCPDVNETSGVADAAGLARFFKERARLHSRKDKEATAFFLPYAFQALTDATRYVIAVCDPDALAARRMLTSFTGTAATVPALDYVGLGFRARGNREWVGSPQDTVAIGDRFVLPSVGARAVVDLVAATSGGASTVRLGPFPAAPVAVTLTGTLQAPVAVAELADGSTARTPVPVATVVATSIRPKVVAPDRYKEGPVHLTLQFKVRAAPGSWASVAPADKDDDEQLPGFGEHASSSPVDASGRVTLSVRDPSSDVRTLLVGVANTTLRRASAMRCTLRWKRSYDLTSVRCKSIPAVPKSGTSIPPRATGARALAALAKHVSARLAPPRVWPARDGDARATAAAVSTPAPALAPIAATTVARLDGFSGASGFQVGTGHFLFGDVTGDGRPDFSTPSVEQSTSLLVSHGAGWQAAKIHSTDAYTDLTAMPDLTGDGVGDLFEVGDQFYGGHREWSTDPPSTVVFRGDRPFGPSDFGEYGGGDYSDSSIGQTPIALPDSTGDGRPELGLFDNALLTVVASEQLPLMQRADIPDVRTEVPGDLYATFKAIARDLEGSGDGRSFDMPQSVRGRAFLPIATSRAGGQRPTVTLSVRPLVFGPTPQFGPAPQPITVGGDSIEVRDIDQTTGEVLLVTTGEACTKKRACVARVRRLAPDGRLEGMASVRTTSTDELQASFIEDGPDPDAMPEVVIHANESASSSAQATDPAKGPAFGGTIALWTSSAPWVSIPSLPVLSAGGGALLAEGPLETWSAPTGERSVGAIIRAAGGRYDLTLLERLVG